MTGKPPNSVEGMATAVWDGRGSVLCSGGKGADGKINNDIFILQLTSGPGASGQWRTLAEWPASVFHGEGFSPRMHHSMSFLPPATFWIFGGVNDEGELLNDLHVFNLAGGVDGQDNGWNRPAKPPGVQIWAQDFKECLNKT